MTSQSLVALALFSLVMSGTPGPNNLILAASGLAFGFRRTLPTLIGIQLGLCILILLSGLGVGVAVAGQPGLESVLKVIGACYLLYLAWRLWNAASLGEAESRMPLKAWQAGLFQFLNPKAWMMVLSAISAFVAPAQDYTAALGTVAAVFLVVSTPTIALWAGFGAAMKAALQDPGRVVLFNRLMAAATALSALMVLRW